jgi:chorismate mutase/prephenate dehydratase
VSPLAGSEPAARRAHDDAASAAIGAELAAKLYGLAVLRRKLQDLPHNVTRFLVIGRPDSVSPLAVETPDVKTSVLVGMRDQPGDLFHCLEPLSRLGINLTRIESRPSRRKAWEYVFFLDLAGHIGDPRVAEALAELSRDRVVKVLGSYRRADET